MNNPSGELAGDTSFTAILSDKEQEVGNSSSDGFLLTKPVKKGLYGTIRTRFDTVLKDHTLQWAEVYHEAGLSKAYASLIRNGHTIPPAPIRIKIANVIGCDTSCLWEAPEIISADIMKEDVKDA